MKGMDDMKNAARKIICAMLLASMILSAAACGSSTDTADPAGESELITDTTPAETEDPRPDTLPDDLDFNGEEIGILWAEGGANTEFTEELNGEIVNDALWQRDDNVENRLNVSISNILKPFTWATRMEYLNTIKSSVMAGDDTYEIATGQYNVLPELIVEGVFYDMKTLPYLDFTQPWWMKGLDEFVLNGKLFLAGGALSIQTIANIQCIFFNQNLIDDFAMDSPYELVKNGEWTLDTLLSLSEDIYSDLNGDGQANPDDRYAFVFLNRNFIKPFMQSCNLHITTIEDGYPTLSFGTERVVSVIEQLCRFAHENSAVYLYSDDLATAEKYANFISGKNIFITGSFSDAGTQYNEMEDKFGVVPYPMFDSAQGNYYSTLGEGNKLFGITGSCNNPDMAAAVLEAISIENYYVVSPAYYETALKTKYSRDMETGQMFDIMRESVVLEFGFIFPQCSSMRAAFFESILKNTPNWMSTYASKQNAVTEGIDELIQASESME